MPIAQLTRWWGFVLDAADPPALGRFYAELLGWELARDGADWVTLKPAEGTAYLGIHRNDVHVEPVWPSTLGTQQQQGHLDFEVEGLAEAVEAAVALGARLHDVQPQHDVRVLVDPVGHLFCLYDTTIGPDPADGLPTTGVAD